VVISRDGTRAAVVVSNAAAGGDAVLLTRVVRSGTTVRLEEPRRVENELSSVIDASWGDADRLAVLATAANGTRQVYDVVVGGTSVVRRGGVRGITAVAAAPGSSILVEAEGSVWENAGSGWRRIGPGTAPVYPG
jgi:predicted ATPase